MIFKNRTTGGLVEGVPLSQNDGTWIIKGKKVTPLDLNLTYEYFAD